VSVGRIDPNASNALRQTYAGIFWAKYQSYLQHHYEVPHAAKKAERFQGQLAVLVIDIPVGRSPRSGAWDRGQVAQRCCSAVSESNVSRAGRLWVPAWGQRSSEGNRDMDLYLRPRRCPLSQDMLEIVQRSATSRFGLLTS
jgi:hypothetical protein